MQTPPSNRVDPAFIGSEMELLEGFLDYHRATLLWKIDGLSETDLRRSMTPSGVSLLGMVKHLAYVEQSWFASVFAGETVVFPWTDADPDADWRIEKDENADSVRALYHAATARSREIVARASLDDLAKKARDKVSLRWIMIHMIEETARHNGHADLMRESIDGAVGE